MPRDLPLGNGSLLVNYDHFGHIRDIYWPHVGLDNHTIGRVNRFGVWCNGLFFWLDDSLWQRNLGYSTDSLATKCTFQHPELKLIVTVEDVVDFHINVFLRRITVENKRDTDVEVRVFLGQDYSISGTTVGDSAYYEPDDQAIFHYKGKYWLMIGLLRPHEGGCKSALDQWAIGQKRMGNHEGAWKDAEDGTLSGNSVAQGSIDSVVAVHFNIGPKAKDTAWYVLAVGHNYHEVTDNYNAVLKKGPEAFLKRTHDYWQLWVNKEGNNLSRLPEDLRETYRRSLLILRTQIDNHGAIIAANDFDIVDFNHDTYSYMWPRDGALVAAALIAAGYSEISRRFFDFCHRVITDHGFLLHKYSPDGSLASSWHAWFRDGAKRLPIQEDETGLVIWALWRHFKKFRDIEFIKHHYRGLVIRAGEWMSSYIESGTGLPKPSWDLWEERLGVHAWTTSATWAGLIAAANFADAFGESSYAERYREVARVMKEEAKKEFWDEEGDCFVRTLYPARSGYERDPVMDGSLMGLWYFGMYAPDDPFIVKTMNKMEKRLWVKTRVGGMARYENDYYHQVSSDLDSIPGNPWFICTLWLAQWKIAAAKKSADLQEAEELLRWVSSRTLSSGVMAEQVNPHTNAPLSVSPLTWSHATFIATALEYNNKKGEFFLG